MNEDEEVEFNIDKATLMDILKRAASQPRTVVEFRTQETEDGGRELHNVIDITEHVEKLES
jgi:hypothetical protein